MAHRWPRGRPSPAAEEAIERSDIEDLALAVRQQIRDGLSVTDAVPLERLVEQTSLEGLYGAVRLEVCTHAMIPFDTWGVTTFSGPFHATIWLNSEAWPELPRRVPRTRFTVAHELGHVMLHGSELEGLELRAEPEHHAQLEREANWFAAHILMPAAAAVHVRHLAAPALASRFGVSIRTAEKRLAEWGSARK